MHDDANRTVAEERDSVLEWVGPLAFSICAPHRRINR